MFCLILFFLIFVFLICFGAVSHVFCFRDVFCDCVFHDFFSCFFFVMFVLGFCFVFRLCFQVFLA